MRSTHSRAFSGEVVLVGQVRHTVLATNGETLFVLSRLAWLTQARQDPERGVRKSLSLLPNFRFCPASVRRRRRLTLPGPRCTYCCVARGHCVWSGHWGR